MKRLLSAGLVLTASLFAQEEPVFPPAPFAPDHYEAMMKRSPFMLPTPTETGQQAPPTNWSTDFRLVNVMRVNEDYVVLVRQVSTDQRFPVRRAPNNLGIRIIDVRMSPDPRNVAVVLEKDGEEGTVQYDDSILSNVPRSVVPDNPALKSE